MRFECREYFVIFDTNVLYHTYEKKADFSRFCFNSTYGNVVDIINQLDIYEHVTLVIPTVVWKEMERQIIEAHEKKLREFRDKISKYHFPEVVVDDTGDIDYAEFIRPIIEEYRVDLSSGINRVVELPIASEARYKSIVERAFDKQPPFEGKDKKSDKGFKDALIWESILEFVSQHSNASVIYYSGDNAFGRQLEDEFSERFPDATLTICSTEDEVRDCLDQWAKTIDIYAYTPIESYIEHEEVINWLQTDAFFKQLNDHDFGLSEKSRLVLGRTLHLISYENIQITNQTDDKIEYSIDATLELTYTIKDGTEIKEHIGVCIIVANLIDERFFVEDVFLLEDSEDDFMK